MSLTDTAKYMLVMFGSSKPEFLRYDLSWYLDRRTLTVLLLAVFFCVPWRQLLRKRAPRLSEALDKPPAVFCRRLAALLLLALCFLFISNSTYNPFIYFRF